MERVARVVKNNEFSREIFSDDDLASAVWPSAVGRAIARHTGRVKLVRNTLVVEVEDGIWQKQLHTLREQILGRLRKVTGSALIEDLEFRVAVPRRLPQRAGSRESTVPDTKAASDEADEIQDAVLKKVYRLSRKKATA